MKRPLFWAAAAFALGGVEGMCLDGGRFIAAVCVTVFIFAAAYLLGDRKYIADFIMLLVFMICGILNVVLRPDCQVNEEKNVSLCGTVYDKKQSENGTNAYVSIDMEDNVQFNIVLYQFDDEIDIGSHIRVEGTLYPFSAADNPGQFDMKSYYMARGIDASIVPDCCYRDGSLSDYCRYSTARKCFLKYRSFIYNLRQMIYERMCLSFDKETAALYGGLLLGSKQDINDYTKSLYQVGGISHILAISGLHVSLLGMGLFRILRRLKTGVNAASVLSVLFVLFYGELAGWGFATIRAVVMLIMGFGGKWVGRKNDMLTALAVSLIIILLINPYRLFDGGMVMSFSAVFGVALGQYVMKRINGAARIKRIRKTKRIVYSVIASVIMSVSLQIVMTPIIIYFYYVYPVYSIPVNLIVLPFMSVILMSGVAASAVSFISPDAAGVIVIAGRLLLNSYEHICELTLSLPSSLICTGRPRIIWILSYYIFVILLILLSRNKIHSRLRGIIYAKTHKWFEKSRWQFMTCIFYGAVIIAGGIGLYFFHVSGFDETIIFLDVGQGDGTLIRTGAGVNMVIDGGSSSEENIGEYILAPALKSQKMARVDYWFVSHTDTDHISGLMEILKEGRLSQISIKNIVLAKNFVADEKSEELVALACEYGANIIYMNVGDIVSKQGDFAVECVHPDDEFSTDDKNSASLAVSYRSDNVSALFTGDMDLEALLYMYENELESDVRYDIIKVPHHGSRYSCLDRLYVNSDMAVISCGENNSYGHPHEETVEVIRECGARLYRTDECGAVAVVFKRFK